jgi:hypothetical protein
MLASFSIKGRERFADRLRTLSLDLLVSEKAHDSSDVFTQ